MALLVGQRRDDLARSFRNQGAGRHPVTDDRCGTTEVQIAVMELDARAAVLAESFLHVGSAVAIGIAKRDDATRGILPVADGHEDVAVRGYVQVPRRAEAVRDDDPAEPVWKLDAAVVGVAFREGRLHRAVRGRERNRRGQGESERTEDRVSHGSSFQALGRRLRFRVGDHRASPIKRHRHGQRGEIVAGVMACSADLTCPQEWYHILC